MRLDKLIHRHVNSIENEMDFSAVSLKELIELEALYEKAGAKWTGTEYSKPDFEKLSETDRSRINEINKKVKIKQVLKRSNPKK